MNYFREILLKVPLASLSLMLLSVDLLRSNAFSNAFISSVLNLSSSFSWELILSESRLVNKLISFLFTLEDINNLCDSECLWLEPILVLNKSNFVWTFERSVSSLSFRDLLSSLKVFKLWNTTIHVYNMWT